MVFSIQYKKTILLLICYIPEALMLKMIDC
jgi:hypothetical protein